MDACNSAITEKIEVVVVVEVPQDCVDVDDEEVDPEYNIQTLLFPSITIFPGLVIFNEEFPNAYEHPLAQKVTGELELFAGISVTLFPVEFVTQTLLLPSMEIELGPLN